MPEKHEISKLTYQRIEIYWTAKMDPFIQTCWFTGDQGRFVEHPNYQGAAGDAGAPKPCLMGPPVSSNMAKIWENHGKTMGKSWENHGKSMGKHRNSAYKMEVLMESSIAMFGSWKAFVWLQSELKFLVASSSWDSPYCGSYPQKLRCVWLYVHWYHWVICPYMHMIYIYIYFYLYWIMCIYIHMCNSV